MSDSHTRTTAPATEETCGKLVDMIGRLGDRWTLPVVLTLRARPHRFNELRRTVDGVSQQMLTRTLKGLQRDGMLTRTVLPLTPPQVEYALTTLGEALADEGARLGGWAHAHLAEIEASRERFDDEPPPEGPDVGPASLNAALAPGDGDPLAGASAASRLQKPAGARG